MALDEKQLSILKSIFSREISEGHLQWTISDLSRDSGASRANIYYRLGRSKKEILTKALKLILEEYYGLSWDQLDTTKSDFIPSIKTTRTLYLRIPEVMVFYQQWRLKTSDIQEILIRYEQEYLNKLKQIYPQLDDERAKGFFSSVQGFIISPLFSQDELLRNVEILLDSYNLR